MFRKQSNRYIRITHSSSLHVLERVRRNNFDPNVNKGVNLKSRWHTALSFPYSSAITGLFAFFLLLFFPQTSRCEISTELQFVPIPEGFLDRGARRQAVLS